MNAAYKWFKMLGLENGFSIGHFCVIYRPLLYYTAVLCETVVCKKGIRVVGQNIFIEYVGPTIFQSNRNNLIIY